MIRPQLISSFLFIIVLFVLMLESNIKIKCLLIFLLGWLYSLCYSVPHIIIIPVLLYIIVSIIFNKKFNTLFLLLFVVLGIAVGLTIHPQFPNTYQLWYIQGVEVVKQILGLGSSQIEVGMGLAAPTVKSIFQNSLIYILLFVNLILLILNRKKSVRGFFLFTTQLLMLIGFLFSKRCIEYAVPAGVICFVYILGNYNLNSPHARIFKFISNLKFYLVLGVLCLLIMSPINKSFLDYRFNAFKVSPCYAFEKWALNNLKPGKYIGLLHWGDFSRLFYVSQQFKYSMALDPMFSYYAYPARTEEIEQFRSVKKPLSPKELSKALGTDLVYCSKYDHIPIMYLIDHGAKVLYYDDQGCLLKISDL
jgi:hypothetical protein